MESQLRRLNALNGHPVEFRAAVEMSEMISVASEADIGLVPIRATNLNHRYCLPNKMFEYMAAGLALVTNDLADPASIVRDLGLGRVVDIDDAEATSRAIIDLAADPRELWECGHRAWEAVGKTFNWEAEFDPLISRLERLIDDRRHSDGALRSAR